MANSFVHTELGTEDVAAAKKFYKKLFDWKLTDMPEMNYTMLDAGTGKVGGGMMKKMMPEAPNAWLPYVEVASVKATIAKAVKAGANAVVSYMPIGEMGAIGIFIDPQGAALGVWEKGPGAPPQADTKAAEATPAAKKPAAKKPAAKKPAAKKPAAKKPAAKATAKAAKGADYSAQLLAAAKQTAKSAAKPAAPAKKPAKKKK